MLNYRRYQFTSNFLHYFYDCNTYYLNMISMDSLSRKISHMLHNETNQIMSTILSVCFDITSLIDVNIISSIDLTCYKFYYSFRPSKYVKVSGGTKVPYDHLILCPGQQYQISAPTAANINKLVNNSQLPNSPDRRYTGRVPKNVFLVNDEHDADRLIQWLEKNFIHTGGKCLSE